MADELADAIRREHRRLIAAGADLRRRHRVLEQEPFDHNEHAAHIARLRAHLEALHLYLAASLPQGRS